MRNLLLAIGHHLFVFTLVSILAIELAWLRPGLRGDALDRLARIDAGYGMSALLILAFGARFHRDRDRMRRGDGANRSLLSER